MLKATFIGNHEKGVSRNYKVDGPATELAKFIDWNKNRVDKFGMPIKNKLGPSVFNLPINIYNENGEVIGKRPLSINGVIIEREYLAGERIGQKVYDFIPDAYETVIKATMESDGVEATTTLVNLGVINKAEINAASYGITQQLPSATEIPMGVVPTLSNTIDLSMPGTNVAGDEPENESSEEN